MPHDASDTTTSPESIAPLIGFSLNPGGRKASGYGTRCGQPIDDDVSHLGGLPKVSRRWAMNSCALAVCERPGIRTAWIAGARRPAKGGASGNSDTNSPVAMASFTSQLARWITPRPAIAA